MPRVIAARHRTTCVLCSVPVEPGESIAGWEQGSGVRWVHERCHPGDTATSVTAPVKSPVTAPAAPASAVPEVFTDGACSGNPGPGGWAWATSDGQQDSGGEPATTNQRMELRAALEAIRALPGRLVVVSDSTYVVNCFRDGWWQGWHARGWQTSARKPVANRDLWEPLVDEVLQRGDVTFRWVKGHSGDAMNDLVDRLAVAAAAEAAG